MTDEAKTGPNDILAGFLGNSGFLKFEDTGEPLEGIYRGCKLEPDPFGEGERIAYTLDVNGEPKVLGSGSKRLAKEVLRVNPKNGTYVKIYRIGSGFDTTYKMEVSPDGMPF